MAVAFRQRRAMRALVLALLAFSLAARSARRGCAAPPDRNPPRRLRARSRERRAGAATRQIRRPAAEQHRLPPDSTTKQTRRCFPAARSPSPRPRARSACSTTRASRRPISPTPPINWTAPTGARRPVTFLFNGGPGAASAYLQLGTAGPWRLPINGDAAMSSASPDLKPNAETWLDFTDLVFIDPVGTGYSRFVATDEDVRKRFFSIDGDVNSIAVDDPPLAGEVRSPAVAQIHRRRKLWRHPRTEDRARIADRAGRRREGTDPDLAGARLPRICRLQHSAICREPADHGGGRARGEGRR